MPSGRPLFAKRKSSMTHYVSQGGRPSDREIERREEGWKEFVSNGGESHIMALSNIVSEYIEEASNLFFEAQNFFFMSLEEKFRSVACDEEFLSWIQLQPRLFSVLFSVSDGVPVFKIPSERKLIFSLTDNCIH